MDKKIIFVNIFKKYYKILINFHILFMLKILLLRFNATRKTRQNLEKFNSKFKSDLQNGDDFKGTLSIYHISISKY